MEYLQNQYHLLREDVLLTLRDESKDICKWIKNQSSFTSYKSEKSFIRHGDETDVPCILSVIRDYDSYKLWVLYEDATSEWFYVGLREVKKNEIIIKKRGVLG